MNGMLIMGIYIAIVAVLTVLFVILVGKTPIFEIYNDIIIIRDLMYPANIPNYTIKSIRMIDKLPGGMFRINGYGGIKRWKGIYGIKNGLYKKGYLYVENHLKAPVIELKTANSLIYINLKTEEQTKHLYDEMMSTIKFVDENELIDCQVISVWRSILVVVVFTAIIGLPSLLHLLI
ncbi:MAG: hypothetical protein K6A73_06625 [Bacteroidales bacterium]|nr:hypothetical protein [Bacteroidales bacterium]